MLRRRSLSKSHRLSIWQSYALTAATYRLTARGLTCQGFEGARKLTQESLKQIRLVVGDPVHMSHRTHQEVLEKSSFRMTPLGKHQHTCGVTCLDRTSFDADTHTCLRPTSRIPKLPAISAQDLTLQGHLVCTALPRPKYLVSTPLSVRSSGSCA